MNLKKKKIKLQKIKFKFLTKNWDFFTGENWDFIIEKIGIVDPKIGVLEKPKDGIFVAKNSDFIAQKLRVFFKVKNREFSMEKLGFWTQKWDF